MQDRITFGFRGAWYISHTSRVIQQKLELFAFCHLLQADFGVRPVERAFHASEIEFLRVCHAFQTSIANAKTRQTRGKPQLFNVGGANQPYFDGPARR